MFKIDRFTSGEINLELKERIRHDGTITIHWDWFTEPDVFIPLMKADAIRRNYKDVRLVLEAPYLPYQRQDRIFNVGQGIPAQLVIDLLMHYKNGYSMINTIGNHCPVDNTWVHNSKFDLFNFDSVEGVEDVYVYPDLNAQSNYFGGTVGKNYITLSKVRDSNGQPKLTIQEQSEKLDPNKEYRFIICDDICADGRTFIEAANFINESFSNLNYSIELLIFHAFLDYGVENIRASGISRINIINKDSYNFIMNGKNGQISDADMYFRYIKLG